MLKKRFKKFIPDRSKLAEIKALQIFGRLIHDPNLWHFNRYSVSMAFSVGLFSAWVPIPFQMVLSAGLAMLFHANLPLSVALVWLTNPATMPVLFFAAYKFGAYLIGVPTQPFEFELSFEWLLSTLNSIGQPFLLGCFIIGLTCAILSNIIIRLLWRYSVSKSWRQRRKNRKQAKESSDSN